MFLGEVVGFDRGARPRAKDILQVHRFTVRLPGGFGCAVLAAILFLRFLVFVFLFCTVNFEDILILASWYLVCMRSLL